MYSDGFRILWEGNMKILRRSTAAKRFAAAAAVTSGLFVATASASEATVLASYTWGSGSHHASPDFTPTTGAMHIGVMCRDGGAARMAYAGIAYTKNGSRAGFASYNQPCDGGWHNDSRTNATAVGGTAYYLKWYGLNNSGDTASAPAAGAGVIR
jgi:hypothetical protein